MNSLKELHAVLARAIASELNASCVFSMPACKVSYAMSGATVTCAVKLPNGPLRRAIVPNELTAFRRGSQRANSSTTNKRSGGG